MLLLEHTPYIIILDSPINVTKKTHRYLSDTPQKGAMYILEDIAITIFLCVLF